MAEESHTYKLIGQHLSFSTTNKQSSFLYVVVYEQIHALQTNPYVTNGAIKKKNWIRLHLEVNRPGFFRFSSVNGYLAC